MNLNWLLPLVLFAQNGKAPEAQPADGGMGLIIQLAPFILIGVLFYYMLIRPQRKEASKRQDMLSNVKKNDRIVTIGGIYGVVLNVHREADEVTIKVDETTNTKLRMTVSSIARVLIDDSPSDDSSK
jgi:preprotein translocase subunit YajC